MRFVIDVWSGNKTWIGKFMEKITNWYKFAD